jgi:hypothetical protein
MSSTTRSVSLESPLDESEQNSRYEQTAKDLFVVTGDPQREIDVEVGASVGCVSSRDVGQRAPKVVDEEHYYLDQDYCYQERCEFEVLEVGRDRKRHNATRKDRPCQGVNHLHGAQGSRNGGLILAKHGT